MRIPVGLGLVRERRLQVWKSLGMRVLHKRVLAKRGLGKRGLGEKGLGKRGLQGEREFM